MRGRDFKVENLDTKEIGYIVGMTKGDGYIYHHKASRHFSVEYFLHSEKDEDIKRYLVQLLTKAGLNPLIFKDKRFKCNRIRVNSKSFFDFLNKHQNDKELETDFKIGFVSGMIDSDGDVISKKNIRIRNTNEKLVSKIKIFLRQLKINVKINRYKWKIKNWSDTFSLYIPNKFININNNSVKIRRLNSR